MVENIFAQVSADEETDLSEITELLAQMDVGELEELHEMLAQSGAEQELGEVQQMLAQTGAEAAF